MTTLKVLNVGQGDSSIISITRGCIYDRHDIYIDLGNGKYDVSQVGDVSCKKILMLSHAHQDHIGGLSMFMNTFGFNKELVEIWMPLFFEEICIITDKILNLRGIQNVSQMSGALMSAQNTVSSFYLLQKLSEETLVNMKGIYKGMGICNHFDVFHPPVDPGFILELTEEEINEYIDMLERTNYSEIYDWFPNPVALELINILKGKGSREDRGRKKIFKDFEDEDFNVIKSHFSYGLLLKLRNDINKFIKSPDNRSFESLFNSLKNSSNNCSIVFKYINKNLDVLFTGDISKKILNHLTKEYELKSKIIKIPHHGSKYNLSKRALKKIDPTYAIISHGNGRFGRQKDPHPNIEVIKMLNDLKINAIYTNDVIKNNKVVINKPSNYQVGPQIEYYDKY